ncbi:MAG: UvrD-helicase domain-containing protein [Firmicutes bacterium]|nr:UvrD-helicase domain-containing protein [Bacillota bacterium]MDY5335291.1 UvrD-helicase domain-containing protein [Bacilli bacterium]
MKIEREEFERERNYLNKTVSLIRKKISKLGQELFDDDSKVLEFKKLIWDTHTEMDPNEMRSMMAESDLQVSIMQSKGNYLQRLFRIQNKPYFGSIRFKEDGNEEEDNIYIGITHVEDKLDYYVHDWRSPICSMFYDYETGPASYKAPSGIIKGNITKKRQYIIEDAELKHIFDNDLNISDSLLQEVLAEESSDKMKNIVNTIQEEQNKVIRNTEDKNLIVEGIAGSGKTSVALHRIAFLLYRIPNLTSSNVVVFTPNKVFSEYISNVLPELGEDNTYDMTFYDLLCQNINEYKDIENFTDFISRYYKGNVDNYDMVKYKQSDEIIKDIDNYINNLLSTIKFNDKLEYDNFIEIDTEELNNMLNYKYNRFPLFERIKEMSKRIASNNYEGSTKNASSIEKKLKELLNIKLDLKDIFNNFYQSKYSKYKDKVNDKCLYYEDACIFLYIKSLLVGFNTNHVIKEIVIDEAQDYNKLQYLIIKKTFKTSNYTILGDTNQTINPYYKYDSLEELTSIFESSKYITLTKTYRSTGKIIDYTNKILGLNHVTAIRNDKASDIIFRNNITKNDFLTDINNLKTTSKSIAIITKNDSEAEEVYNMLKDDLDIMLIDGFGHIKRDLVVVPSYVAKGLEFDSVIIYTDKDNKYQEKDKYLFYVACTRAQHNLIIYNNSK